MSEHTDAVKSGLGEAGVHLKQAATAAGGAVKSAAAVAGDELRLGKAQMKAELADGALSGLGAAEHLGAAAGEQAGIVQHERRGADRGHEPAGGDLGLHEGDDARIGAEVFHAGPAGQVVVAQGVLVADAGLLADGLQHVRGEHLRAEDHRHALGHRHVQFQHHRDR